MINEVKASGKQTAHHHPHTIQAKWEAVTDVGQLPPTFKSYLSIFNFYFSASPLAVVGQ